MRFFRFASVLLGVASAAAAQAQMHQELQRCRAIADDVRRLACYDAVELSAAAPRSKYEAIDLAELKTYALSFRGRFVEVSGWLRPERDYLLLGLGPEDEDPMPVGIETLPRRQRDDVLEACGSGCSAIVRGRVRPLNFTTGVVADDVILR
jgi:hypothetical protein